VRHADEGDCIQIGSVDENDCVATAGGDDAADAAQLVSFLLVAAVSVVDSALVAGDPRERLFVVDAAAAVDPDYVSHVQFR
jgi:hypothetical protein